MSVSYDQVGDLLEEISQQEREEIVLHTHVEQAFACSYHRRKRGGVHCSIWHIKTKTLTYVRTTVEWGLQKELVDLAQYTRKQNGLYDCKAKHVIILYKYKP